MKTRYRWWVGALLFGAGMLNYLDRAALSVVAPIIKRDLGIGDAQMGVLFSSFFVGYCVFCFVGGWAADRFGPRRVFAWAAGVWSLFCGATALAGSFVHLLVVRVAFGIGEGPMGTTTNKAISNWFPRREAGRAVGWTNAGQPLGAAIAAPIVGLVALQFGWRVSFVVIAALGFLWLVAWWRLFRDEPAAHPRVSLEEAREIAADRGVDVVHGTRDVHAADAHAARPLLHYLLSRPVLGVALAFFSFNYVLYFFLSWLPSYLTDYQHLNIKQMSVVGILPWLGATVGFVAGGTVSDRIYRHSGDVLFARKIVIVVGLGVAAACVLLASRVNSLGAAVTLIAIASLFAFMAPQACWSLLQEIVPRERVGAAGGFVHLLANLAGILSPSLTGWLVQYGGGYAGAFVLAGASALAGAAILTVAVRPRTVAQMRGAV
ncbi:MFS transporter [Burkholderia multivorans]|uniref:MFS transporter n=1 Tax=Burkholderia multivorans TaxID=87883 RepID=UPI000CFE6873|nr:MFS transporter [Burkholderia multivorans]MBU9557967.1 MFS transporter [Burkholderia multivorans]MDN7867331.1 MFS transporter [Burkholderia multivorans]MDN7999768.1 MFS transporter [Burkholderia multivorans]PRE98373.1 MFS transporter [Burkholderia multivorans]PRH03722.1 MFS transporter [Burkholderia multivorans]